jgi:predicted  nucleic acid-binding Zn-ribbon protein
VQAKAEQADVHRDDHAHVATAASPRQQDGTASLQAVQSSIPSLRTPRSHTSEEDMSQLLKQLRAANSEIVDLKETVAGLREQQVVLQAQLNNCSGGSGTVSMTVHQQVLSQNKKLQAQLQQLRMDLELLYMDEQLATSGHEGASMGLAGMNAGAPTSFLSTVHRLGALLGVSESQRSSQV